MAVALAGVAQFDLGAGARQQRGDVDLRLLTLERRLAQHDQVMQGRLQIAIGGVDVGVVREQQLHHARPAATAGQVQRRAQHNRTRVDHGAGSDQKQCKFLIAQRARPVQRALVQQTTRLVHVGARRQQHFGNCGLTCTCCVQQCSPVARW
jgi:hypothetical protein